MGTCHKPNNKEAVPIELTKARFEINQGNHKYVVNLAEELIIKKHPRSTEERIIAAYDTCSHSNWCSSAFAARLPQRKKKEVCLNLSTITDKKLFKTYEYTIFVK